MPPMRATLSCRYVKDTYDGDDTTHPLSVYDYFNGVKVVSKRSAQTNAATITDYKVVRVIIWGFWGGVMQVNEKRSH